MLRLQGGYWDQINGRIPQQRFYSSKPMFPCSFLGPVRVPDPGELEQKATQKERLRRYPNRPEFYTKPHEPSQQDEIEEAVHTEAQGKRQAEIDALPGIEEARAELDAEFSRKQSKDAAGVEMSKRVKAPAESGLSYPKRNKEKGNE